MSKIRLLLPVLISFLGIYLMLDWAPYHTALPAILAEPFPNPNGYDDLIAAGKMVSTNAEDVTNLDLAGLRQLVAQDADAIARARLGLSRECRAPLNFPRSAAATHFDEVASFRSLASAFEAEGRLSEMENRPADAVRPYLDLVKLGQSSARGGVMFDQMIGTGVEHMGTKCLKEFAGQLDAKSCRETAATLETLDAQRQPWQEVLLQERYWSLRAFPGIQNRLVELFTAGQLKEARKQTETKFNEQAQRTRLLLIMLTARAYQLEKGHAPATLNELVPDYLKAVPQDPVTGKPMAYSP